MKVIWFFVGDSFEWLEAFHRVTGITRVTLELFSAAFESSDTRPAIAPCVISPGQNRLAAVSLDSTCAYFASKIGDIGKFPPALPSPRVAFDPPLASDLEGPRPGDHVMFTGVVWDPKYTALFGDLRKLGIDFSVLLYDIIPLEHPEFVDTSHYDMFVVWIRTIVSTASIIFVSSHIIMDQLFEWAKRLNLDVSAALAPIRFGSSQLNASVSAGRDERRGALPVHGPFVLSVGTIDHRKNQMFICKIWKRLILEIGERAPLLVLVGRNCLKYTDAGTELRAFVATSRAVVLEDVADADLAELYRSCLFTVFPSLSDGHGLPVAESLAFGKLCLSSNLATITEHAGDLAWYFDPNAEPSAYDLVRHAVERPDLRMSAERSIHQRYVRIPWISTYRSMIEAIEAGQRLDRGVPSR